jgi:hypothetical protein
LNNYSDCAVSFSADGNTLAVSSLIDLNPPPGTGLVNIWTRIGNLWTLKTQLQDKTTYPGEFFQAIDVALIASGAMLFTANYGDPTLGTPLIRIFR